MSEVTSKGIFGALCIAIVCVTTFICFATYQRAKQIETDGSYMTQLAVVTAGYKYQFKLENLKVKVQREAYMLQNFGPSPKLMEEYWGSPNMPEKDTRTPTPEDKDGDLSDRKENKRGI